MDVAGGRGSGNFLDMQTPFAGVQAEGGERLPQLHSIQITFASSDAVHAMKYRDMVDSHTNGWRATELLMPGIDDTTWFERWSEGLSTASACLVVFTDVYRKRISARRRTALHVEADAIVRRMRRDRHFKVFVLDPVAVGQDYANLKLYLDLNQPSMNVEVWREYLKGKHRPRGDGPSRLRLPSDTRAGPSGAGPSAPAATTEVVPRHLRPGERPAGGFLSEMRRQTEIDMRDAMRVA